MSTDTVKKCSVCWLLFSSWPCREAATSITQVRGYDNPSKGLNSNCFRNLHFTSKPHTGVYLMLTVSTLTFCSSKVFHLGIPSPKRVFFVYMYYRPNFCPYLRTDVILLWLEAKNERKKEKKVTRSHNNFLLNCKGCFFTFANRLHFY